MADRTIDRTRLLPRSGIDVVVPWLVIAPPGNPVIRIDLTALDRVEIRPESEPDEEAREPTNDPDHDRRCDVLLVCGDLEVTVYVADGPEAAADIVRQAAPLTREAAATAAPGGLDVLFVDGDVVCQRGEYIQVGTASFRSDEVREYARRGANLPLAEGRLLQAALAMLVVAVAERDAQRSAPANRGHDQSASERDVAALQGLWEQIDLEVDGVANPPEPHAHGALTTFTADQFSVRTPDGTLILAGAFVLDASTTPKSITWIDSMGEDIGKRLPAIYTLDGDNFVFIAGNEGDPRPSAFKTTPGQTMRTFVRRQ